MNIIIIIIQANHYHSIHSGSTLHWISIVKPQHKTRIQRQLSHKTVKVVVVTEVEKPNTTTEATATTNAIFDKLCNKLEIEKFLRNYVSIAKKKASKQINRLSSCFSSYHVSISTWITRTIIIVSKRSFVQ